MEGFPLAPIRVQENEAAFGKITAKPGVYAVCLCSFRCQKKNVEDFTEYWGDIIVHGEIQIRFDSP